jgi:KaiC/GvpD/RAD55 family RecA-like ATPase
VESLLQSARRKDDGEALPTVFKTLGDKGFHFYRGSVYVTAAAPNVGKSPFALSHMLGMPETPCLYICADTPRHITVVRTVQMLTTTDQAHAEAELEDNSSEVFNELAKANHIGAFYRSGISAEDVALMIGAFAEIKGEFPHYVVIDNLINIAYEGDSELQAQRQIMAELDTIAKDANICIHILTHVSGSYKNGITPIPQDGVMNKISEFQHGTLALTRGERENELLIGILKNRTGIADPSGTNRFGLHANFALMELHDQTIPTVVVAETPRPQNSSFPAKYAGECHECHDFIDVGDPIVIDGGVYHEHCV